MRSYISGEVGHLLLEVEFLISNRVVELDLHHDWLLPHHRVHNIEGLHRHTHTWCTTSREKGCRVVELRGFIVSFTCFSTAAWIVTSLSVLFVLFI